MINNTKSLVVNTFVLNSRLLVSLIIGLYTSRCILSVLGVENFGLYNLVGGFVALLSIFTSSVTSTSRRFLTCCLGEGNSEKLNNTFSTIIIVLFVLASIVGLCGSFAGQFVITRYLNVPSSKVGIALFVFYCSISVFILDMLAVPYTALVTAHEKMFFLL